MKTLSIIGSDKNAGKTTVFNFIYNKLLKQRDPQRKICLSSIGLNGEITDNYEEHGKPQIQIARGDQFITASEHVKAQAGYYIIKHVFSPPFFKKNYILGEALMTFPLLLEGPNERNEFIHVKTYLNQSKETGYLIIDGSIDRQFIAHPDISDDFYFALLISERHEQISKARDLLLPLTFPACPEKIKTIIDLNKSDNTKTLLLNEAKEVLHHGSKIPFMDDLLYDICIEHTSVPCFLYLNGALSKSLYNFLAPFYHLNIILDNFTLYHNVSINQQHLPFRPRLWLYHKIKVNKVFLKQDTKHGTLEILQDISAANLFRENTCEIGI